MKVYIAGPLSHGDVAGNVHQAMDAAAALLEAGHAVYVPHLFHFMEVSHPQPYERWLSQDFAWIAASDALVRLPGESSGADREVAFARDRGIPVWKGPIDITTLKVLGQGLRQGCRSGTLRLTRAQAFVLAQLRDHAGWLQGWRAFQDSHVSAKPGATLASIERRGWAEARWPDHNALLSYALPYRKSLEWRITQSGRAALAVYEAAFGTSSDARERARADGEGRE